MDKVTSASSDAKGSEVKTEGTTAAETAAPASAIEAKTQYEDVGDVPDPDEDDLDDLDDMLEDFAAVNVDATKPVNPTTSEAKDPTKQATVASAPEEDHANPGNDGDFSEEDFAKQLQAGMADLLGELEKSPDMQAQFEEMFKQMSSAAATEGADPLAGSSEVPGASASASAAGSGTGAGAGAGAGAASAESPSEASFQDTIRRTMERMQTSGDQATAAASSGASDDFMTEMLKQLSSGDFNAEGSEEDFSKMLMGMMEQLTNKDILYEPMKELDEKFPEWLAKNREKTPAEDLKRYEEQQSIVRDIVARFEKSTYADSNTADREFIVDKMQKMQAAGSPPPDLVGDMSSAQDAFNAPDEACNPQ